MMYIKEAFEDYLKQMGEALDVKCLFSEVTRKEDYRPYFKSEDELNWWLSFPDNVTFATLNKLLLEELLVKLESEDAIEYFNHVAQFTINHKTNKKANYSKSMFSDAIRNNLVKYL